MLLIFSLLIAFAGVYRAFASTTIATGIAGVLTPHSLALDSTATYAYEAIFSRAVYKINIASGGVSNILAASQSNNYAIALDSSNIYLGGWNEVAKCNSLTGACTLSTVSFSVNPVFRAGGMVVDGSTLYVADDTGGESLSTGRIWKVSLPYSSASDFTQLSLTLNYASYTPASPAGIAVANGNLYFVECGANKFSKVVVDVSGNSGAVTNIITSGIDRPRGAAVDPSETYGYISTWTTPANAILKVDLAATNSFTTIAVAQGAFGLALFSDDLYATSEDDLVRLATVIPSPTGQPTGQPSRQPTGQPTRQPSRQPTGQPSRQPTGQPTGQPTSQLSHQPIGQVPTASASEPASSNKNLGFIAFAAIPVGGIIYYVYRRRRNNDNRVVVEEGKELVSPP